MPFVRMTRQIEVPSIYGGQTVEIETYVPPHKLTPDMTVIPIEKIPPRQLEDLRRSYPDEFGEPTTGESVIELIIDQFLSVPTTQAVSHVMAASLEGNTELLERMAEAELEQAKPRKAVMRALAKAGVALAVEYLGT